MARHRKAKKQLEEEVAALVEGLPVGAYAGPRRNQNYVPSPQEIEERTTAFQEGWTEEDRANRRGMVSKGRGKKRVIRNTWF